jgi:glycosyltransferase involved in cell wall biosynthesis
MLKASIVITTKNRKEELRQCLASCLEQRPPVEVLVIDDGSTDGTSALVAQEFPAVRLIRFDVSEGLIAQRNRGAQFAGGELIFSLDDDAVFSTPDIVRTTIEEFQHPRVGAVAIPRKQIENGIQSRDLDRSPDPTHIYACCSYAGCAHAVRRDLFLRLGGYRKMFTYGCEENEFGVRLLNAGYIVRVGNADSILHSLSPIRNRAKQVFHNVRGTLLWKWSFVPGSLLPLQLAGVIVNSLACGLRRNGYLFSRVKGLLAGLIGCVQERRARNPISLAAYKLFREMGRRGAMPLDEVSRRMGWETCPEDRASI